MPLSEHEERILAEIERQLAAEDPRFVARARRGPTWSRSTRMRLAIATAIVGVIGVLSIGFIESGLASFFFGAIGMTMLFAAILLGVTAAKQKPAQQRTAVPPDERT